MTNKTEKFALAISPDLLSRVTRAAAQATIDTSKLVSASQWVREACEMRLEKDGG